MPPRLLEATASDFRRMNGSDLAESIRLAEGRTLAAEVICTTEPPIEGVSHGELAAAMGADLIALDQYDPRRPVIRGAPSSILEDAAPLAAYKRLLGRPVAVNMVVADPDAGAFLGGRLATPGNVALAVAQGLDSLFLYVRPKMGGTTPMMVETAQAIRFAHADSVMVIGVPSFSQPPPRDQTALETYRTQIAALLDAGCAGVGLPMPGTKQGWLADACARLVDDIHSRQGLAWLFLTGSVEGAPEPAMHALALEGKRIGADAFRLDEAGLSGMAPPENILAFSLALRGKRHTYHRMAASILR